MILSTINYQYIRCHEESLKLYDTVSPHPTKLVKDLCTLASQKKNHLREYLIHNVSGEILNTQYTLISFIKIFRNGFTTSV